MAAWNSGDEERGDSERLRAVGFAIGWAILAGVVGLLVWFMIHPAAHSRRLVVNHDERFLQFSSPSPEQCEERGHRWVEALHIHSRAASATGH